MACVSPVRRLVPRKLVLPRTMRGISFFDAMILTRMVSLFATASSGATVDSRGESRPPWADAKASFVPCARLYHAGRDGRMNRVATPFKTRFREARASDALRERGIC